MAHVLNQQFYYLGLSSDQQAVDQACQHRDLEIMDLTDILWNGIFPVKLNNCLFSREGVGKIFFYRGRGKQKKVLFSEWYWKAINR